MEDNGQRIGGMVNLADARQTTRDVEAQRKYAARLQQDRKFATTMSQTGSWVNWNEMADVLGQPWNANKIPFNKLELMRRDPMIAFGLMFCKVPIMRAKWKVESADPQRAAFIENALKQIYGRFVLSYLNCLDFGFSPIIKRFEYSNPDWRYIDPNTDEEKDVWPYKTVQALIWKPFMPLNPKNCKPKFNSKGEFAGIDLIAGSEFAYGVFGSSDGRPADVPLDWALWATNEKDSEYGSLYGYPRTGYAYRYWWSYWYKFGLSDRAFEKWGDPPFVVFHPADQGVEDADGNEIDFGNEALATAEQLRSGANVAMPSSVIRGYTEDRPTNVREWDFKQVETTANFDALNQSFEYLDIQKLRSVMVPEQGLVEGRGGSSSRNVAAEFGDLIKESQAVIMEEIDDHINRFMIPQLLEVNFGPGPTCKKITTGFDPQDVETMRDIIQGIVNAKGELPEADVKGILEQLNVPQLSHAAIQRRMEQIAAEQDAQNQQQNDAKVKQLVAQAALKGHKVDPSSLKGVSLEDKIDEINELAEESKNIFVRGFDKIFGTGKIIREEEFE